MTNGKVPEFVRVLVKDTCNRVLVVVHKDAQKQLNFPGGKVEIGERPEDAAHREIYEETGMLLTSTKLLTSRRIKIGDVEWAGYFYVGESSDILPRNMEPQKHSFVGFCDFDVAKEVGHKHFVAEPLVLASHLFGR